MAPYAPANLTTEESEQSMSIILKGGTLLDGTGSPALPNSVVIITDGKFSYVGNGADVDYSQADQVIDLEGFTLLPGLIDCHEHQIFTRTHGAIPEQFMLGPRYLLVRSVGAALRRLSEGVTTAREMGSIEATNLLMRVGTERELVLGPRIATCGQPIALTGGHAFQLCMEADGVEQVRKVARKLIKSGVDFVKVMTSNEGPNKAVLALKAAGKPLSMPQFSEEEIRAAVEEAHNAGKKAAAHSGAELSIRRCINAGIDCIEHGYYLSQANADLMAKRGVFLVPTLGVHFEQTDTSWERGALKAEIMKCLFAALQVSFKNALQAGVPLAVGTDALPDMALEMKLMIDLGLSPMDAIVAATRGGAQVLGMEDEIGTVEPGKLADLVVVRGDPLADIMAIRDVEMVIKQGDVLRPDHLPDLPPYAMDKARTQSIGYKGYNESLTVHNV